MVIKLCFVVSTLQRKGPTRQLLNIITNLDARVFDTTVITLSPEPADSLISLFKGSGIKVLELNLGRLEGMLKAERQLRRLIENERPDVIHTQGIRADMLVASLSLPTPWVATARNFPFDDYPMKFGPVAGNIMAFLHIRALRKCPFPVACSKTISSLLQSCGINSVAVPNGVAEVAEAPTIPPVMLTLQRPVFITVGSLITRKNMQCVVKAFDAYRAKGPGSLVVLGDGPERQSLQQIAGDGTLLLGNVPNVSDYLAYADCFVSASLSEGLPNTVLEALAVGLPVILSRIPSHQEIADECRVCCDLFDPNVGTEDLESRMQGRSQPVESAVRRDALRVAQEVFSAQRMSKDYQRLYLSLSGVRL